MLKRCECARDLAELAIEPAFHRHLGRSIACFVDDQDSGIENAVRERFKTALLPQAYPEGSPTHPSYPAGHAVISGACATVLKACLDESHVLPEPVQASPDGLPPALEGADLTVGGELDKLAANISLGRDFAGLHWRSDAVAGLHLGEEVAIRTLGELASPATSCSPAGA